MLALCPLCPSYQITGQKILVRKGSAKNICMDRNFLEGRKGMNVQYFDIDFDSGNGILEVIEVHFNVLKAFKHPDRRHASCDQCGLTSAEK